jgi:uncharacterized protein
MNKVFADTFYFLALLNPRDHANAKAVAAAQQVTFLVTTEWVLLELADALASTSKRSTFDMVRQGLLSNPAVNVEPLSSTVHEEGIALFRNRPDKEWSLTDCVSFTVMQRDGITEALTGDHHFEQAGFVALLK